MTLADAGFYASLVDTARTLRNDLSAGLTDTVSSIYLQFDIGEKSPADIISAQGRMQEFNSGEQLTEQSAVAALVARSYAMPSDVSKTLKLTGGTTVPSGDYNMAYVVYESAVDGTTKTAMLSGTADLEILEYTGESMNDLSFVFDDQGGATVKHVHITEDHDALSPDSAAMLNSSC